MQWVMEMGVFVITHPLRESSRGQETVSLSCWEEVKLIWPERGSFNAASREDRGFAEEMMMIFRMSLAAEDKNKLIAQNLISIQIFKTFVTELGVE